MSMLIVAILRNAIALRRDGCIVEDFIARRDTARSASDVTRHTRR